MLIWSTMPRMAKVTEVDHAPAGGRPSSIEPGKDLRHNSPCCEKDAPRQRLSALPRLNLADPPVRHLFGEQVP